MLDKIELQWLLSFQAAYQQRSFKSAAEQLQIPSSNVSRHVALLEQQLNLRLLERTTRRMTPTTAGEQIYQSLTPLLQAMDDTLEEVTHHTESLSGHLKIITPDLPFLAEAVADFCCLHPQLELSSDTQINPGDALLEGYDLVLRFARGALEDSGWVAKEIIRWPSAIVVAPSLLKETGKPESLAALATVPCITTLSVLQGMPWRFKDNDTLSVKSSYKVNSGQMAKAAAIKGLGFALLPLDACKQEIYENLLIKVDLEKEPEDLVLYAIYSGRKYPLEKVKVFLDFLKEKVRQHPAT